MSESPSNSFIFAIRGSTSSTCWGVPGAKPKEGYDFAVIDLQVDAKGGGTGTIAPAAKIKLNQDAFVVEDYSGEVVRLTAVKKTK